jgi:hypothetical protein
METQSMNTIFEKMIQRCIQDGLDLNALTLRELNALVYTFVKDKVYYNPVMDLKPLDAAFLFNEFSNEFITSKFDITLEISLEEFNALQSSENLLNIMQHSFISNLLAAKEQFPDEFKFDIMGILNSEV